MQVDFSGGLFTVRCTFDERNIPKDAGFDWHPELRRWTTDDPRVALKVQDHLTPQALRLCVAPDRLLVPDGLEYLPFQDGGIRFGMQRKNTLIADEPGLGKGHPLTTHIATPSGFRAVGDLKIGDNVIGSSGKPTRITGLYDRGVLPVFTVHTGDGGTVTVDGEHLWLIYDSKSDDWITETTIQIAARCNAGQHVMIPTLGGPVQFAEREFPVPPRVAALDAANRHIYAEMPKLDYRAYQFGSVSQRMAFLTAVVRTLGRVRDGKIRLDILAPRFRPDFVDTIIQITRSLGGLAYREEIYRKARLVLHLPDDVWLPIVGYTRATERINARWKKFVPGVPARNIVKVRPAGFDTVRCLSVAARDRLYVTEDYLVTHNTIQAIGIGNQIPELDSMLVVCFASLKEHWRREIKKWDVHGLSVDIAHGDFMPDSQAVVINYDILDRHYDAIRAGKWGMLVCDEAHALQSQDSKRSKNVFGGRIKVPKDAANPKSQKIIKRLTEIDAARGIFLTGTPIPNRPKNIWPLVKKCDPLGLGLDYDAFAYRFCGAYETPFGMDDNGSSNEDELHNLLHERLMIRRLKADVLKDLPPKTRQVIPLSDAGLDRKLAAERDAIMELLHAYEVKHGITGGQPDPDVLAAAILNAPPQVWEDYASTADGEIDADTPLNKLAIARQELAIAKIPMIVEHVENLLQNEEKVIVFAYHRAVIMALREAFKKYNPSVIFGDTPMTAKRDYTKCRQGQADKFQEDPTSRVFIGQYTAAGTGFTLTRARVVVCAELTWVPHELTQAEDRAHRIGQLCNVLVHHLIVMGSLDDAMINGIFRKQVIIERILDGVRRGGDDPNFYKSSLIL